MFKPLTREYHYYKKQFSALTEEAGCEAWKPFHGEMLAEIWTWDWK